MYFAHLPLWNVKEYAKMGFSELQNQISQNALEIPKNVFCEFEAGMINRF